MSRAKNSAPSLSGSHSHRRHILSPRLPHPPSCSCLQQTSCASVSPCMLSSASSVTQTAGCVLTSSGPRLDTSRGTDGHSQPCPRPPPSALPSPLQEPLPTTRHPTSTLCQTRAMPIHPTNPGPQTLATARTPSPTLEGRQEGRLCLSSPGHRGQGWRRSARRAPESRRLPGKRQVRVQG